MGQTPHIFFHLLADRHLNPGAVELRMGDGCNHGLLPLITDSRFSGLAANIPCLLMARCVQHLSPELVESLRASGVRITPDEAIHRSDETTRPTLPATAAWLAGEWSLARQTRSTGRPTGTRSLALKLLQKVAEDADTREIEAIFRQEPVLAYHLLRLVNSLSVGVGRTISSFSQAILILGRQQLKRWLNLMLFAANRDDHRSAMLLARVAVRARSMELLAKAAGLDRSMQEHAFMTGMFSLLGCLFGMPLADVLQPLKLHPSLTDALLQRGGDFGLLLNIVDKSEHADGAENGGLSEQLACFGLSTAEHSVLTIEAYQWMLDVIREQEAAHA